VEDKDLQSAQGRRVSDGDEMEYENGCLIQTGGIVIIDDKYSGQVVASMDTSTYLLGYESWAYLVEGIMVMTDFAGLVQYTSQATDRLVLKTRNSQQ
jgi:hypothetical protein